MITFVLGGVIVPAAAAIAVAYLSRYLPQSASRRYTLPVALALGFVVGYSLLPSWAEWVPTRHWHWLPYLAIAAAIVGPIGFARGVWTGERWLLNLILAIGSAGLLVPSWSSLESTRYLYVAFLSGYLFVLTTSLPPLADRVSTKVLIVLLSLVSVVLTFMILATVSLRYGQLAGLLSCAVLGCSLYAFLYDKAVSLHSFVSVFSILAGELAFVGFIEPEPPLAGLLVLPAAPLALWVVARLPLPKEGRLKPIVQVAAVVAMMFIGIGWTILGS